MKKNIAIVALVSVITGSIQAEPMSGYSSYRGNNPPAQGRTWGEYLGQKAQSVNQAVNPYQYRKIEKPRRSGVLGIPTIEQGAYEYAKSNLQSPSYAAGFRGINPTIGRANFTPEEALEVRTFELPVKELAIAGGAYLAGRWAWNKFMTSEFKKVENKITQASKTNDDLITQITNAEKNKKATADDLVVLAIYKKAATDCQNIFDAMKREIELHRKK